MSGPSPAAPVARRISSLGAPMLGLLVVEFLLGMALALFVTLPSGGPVAVLEGAPLLWIHIAVGFLLIGISANALRWAIAAGEGTVRAVTALGLASAVGAFLAGMAFAFGDQSPVASYAMSVGFVGVLIDAGYLLQHGSRAAAAGSGARPIGASGEG